MTYDNSNRKNIREAEKSAKLAETNRIAYTKTIMSTLFGRAWLHDLLTRCNVFHTPFVAGAPDRTSFNCGSQNIGLQLFGDVAAHCPHEYTLMMSEASIKDQVHDRRYSESGDDANESTSERRYGNSAESGGYIVGQDGFVEDNSGPEGGGEGSAGHLQDLEPRYN